MQGEQSEKRTLSNLVVKIKRLRKRLVSYGWNKHEAVTFILFEFLKLPEPDWRKPSSTVTYHHIKEKYKVETNTAELILSLQEIVPNLHSEDVLEYLHSVFYYSSLNFGFQLLDSSSDSGENPHIYKRSLLRHQRPTRTRPIYRDHSPESRKKTHYQSQKEQAESNDNEVPENVKRQQVKVVRKRKYKHEASQLEDWEKRLKKDQT